MIGHFQRVRLVGKVVPGCLVHCQTLDNLNLIELTIVHHELMLSGVLYKNTFSNVIKMVIINIKHEQDKKNYIN